jgi:hypothetical protein
MSGQSGNLTVSSAFERGFEGRRSLRERHSSRDSPKKLNIHRLWSQESITCPIVRNIHRKNAEKTTSQVVNDTLSIVVSKPDDGANEAEQPNELSESASTISRAASIPSIDSFDSTDDWDDDDDDDDTDDNTLDLCLVSHAVYYTLLFLVTDCLFVHPSVLPFVVVTYNVMHVTQFVAVSGSRPASNLLCYC